MSDNNFTMKNFKFNTYAYKTIESTGWLCSSGKYDINESSILTTLIQEAGRWCESFASDLFIDWQTVVACIDDIYDGEKQTFLFGFRQHGVDTAAAICSKFNQYGYSAGNEYRAIWRLELKAEGRELTMKLGRVS